MCVRVRVSVSACARMYAHIHDFNWTRVRMHECTHLYTCVCVSECTTDFKCTCVRVYARTYVYVYIHMYGCMRIQLIGSVRVLLCSGGQ